MDIKGMPYEGVDMIRLAQHGVQWRAMKLLFAYKAGNFLTSRATISFQGVSCAYPVVSHEVLHTGK
jgi:hypothetical protein